MATLAAIGSLAVMAAPAQAERKTFRYEGWTTEKGSGASVAFDVVKRASGARRVKNFSVFNLPHACDNATWGTITHRQEFPRTMPVRAGGLFEGLAQESWANGNSQDPFPGEFAVEGDLDRGGVASGTLRKDFEYDDSGPVHCSSGEQAWTAERTRAR